jgi:hypothetical protein
MKPLFFLLQSYLCTNTIIKDGSELTKIWAGAPIKSLQELAAVKVMPHLLLTQER